MIKEKAKELLELLKRGTGSATIFGSSYYDEETQEIIEIITNECKSTVVREDGTSKKYESDTYIHEVREIVEQLLTDKNTIKNSLVNSLTSISDRNIAGVMTPIKVNKKINEKGNPYIEIEKPLPDNLNGIISGEMDREELTKKIINPYIARVCKSNEQLSKKHFFSKIFSPLNRKEITDGELEARIENYLRKSTNLDENKICNTTKYFTYNILGNQNIINEIIDDEIKGNSLQVIGEKHKIGYNGMIQNMSNDLLDILNTIPNPNKGLKEVENIYANIVGQLEALSLEPGKEPDEIEEQIKCINRNINRNRQEYYSENGYRNVNVGFRGKDVGLLDNQFVPQAMKLYSQQIVRLLEKSEQISEEQYIKEVAKLHFRFVQIHPFPDGNGRTARAISNMLLLEKNMTAVFSKQNKGEYIEDMNALRSTILPGGYIKGLYTDQNKCSELEENKVYKLEEYIGIKCLGRAELYKERQITEELSNIEQEQNSR